MKKTVLSLAAIATVSMAGGEIAPAEPTVEAPIEETSSFMDSSFMDSSFMDRFHFKGDLRLRYESIEREDAENTYRNRYRLRLVEKVDLIENLQFEVGMRSGFANPTSGNQTFYDDEPLKDYFFESLRFNILGLTYKSDSSTYQVGRQPYLMYRPIKSQLIWDNDVSVNGVNYQYQDDTKIITLGVNQPTLQEAATSAANNVNLFLAQYVHKSNLDFAKLHLGTGVYFYDGLKGNIPLFGSSLGNTLDADGLYVNDYHMVEGFGELQFKDVFGMPFKVAAEVVYNFGADDNNFGYDLAFQLGKAKDIGDWQIKYSYTDLEADATYAAYSDSDNFGGGTAASGSAIRVKYKMGKNTYLAGNFFFDTLDQSKAKNDYPGDPSYDRVQLDVIVDF